MPTRSNALKLAAQMELERLLSGVEESDIKPELQLGVEQVRDQDTLIEQSP